MAKLSQRSNATVLIIVGLIVVLLVILVWVNFRHLIISPLQTKSESASYSIAIIDEQKLEELYTELGLLRDSGGQFDSVKVVLTETDQGKNLTVGENNTVMASSSYQVNGSQLVIFMYANPEVIGNFDDDGTSLVNHQLVSTLLSMNELATSLFALPIEEISGSTVQDKRMNYLLQKYFDEDADDDQNFYPIEVRKNG